MPRGLWERVRRQLWGKWATSGEKDENCTTLQSPKPNQTHQTQAADLRKLLWGWSAFTGVCIFIESSAQSPLNIKVGNQKEIQRNCTKVPAYHVKEQCLITFATCKKRRRRKRKWTRETSFSSVNGTQKGLDPKKGRNVSLLWQLEDLNWLLKIF